jgi:hypothetical protein
LTLNRREPDVVKIWPGAVKTPSRGVAGAAAERTVDA